ncbi:MAG: transcriptional activator NhaR [Immundisolibacter sp.]|uniref:transcriptional activator NhaR n=1 Tax=Immundisolibacter sp. TaxID=1934948 RepID=UPI003D09C4BE
MRGLNYNHLYYFWIVAREGSVVGAAKALFLTPQTVTGQLRALERTLGGRLFAPAGRGIALTELGHTVFGYAQEIFRLGSELQAAVTGRSVDRPLPFRVGAVDALSKVVVQRLLAPALALGRAVHLSCREGPLEELAADLALHKLDLVLADTPLAADLDLRAFNHLLGESGIAFFAAPALRERYPQPFPQVLAEAPLLLPAPRGALRGAIDHWLDRHDIRPHIAGEFDDSSLMKSFGKAGVGAFPSPGVVADDIARQYGVVLLGSTDDVRERFYAISTERRVRHPAVMAVTESARSELFAAP